MSCVDLYSVSLYVSYFANNIMIHVINFLVVLWLDHKMYCLVSYFVIVLHSYNAKYVQLILICKGAIAPSSSSSSVKILKKTLKCLLSLSFVLTDRIRYNEKEEEGCIFCILWFCVSFFGLPSVHPCPFVFSNNLC